MSDRDAEQHGDPAGIAKTEVSDPGSHGAGQGAAIDTTTTQVVDAQATEVLSEAATQIVDSSATQLVTTKVAPVDTRVRSGVPAQPSPGMRTHARTIRERFVLEERLGKGGMGEVYRALDLRKQELKDDQPYVAIKFLGEAFSKHPQALISLQREAKKTQALAHPNILTVYDFDRDDSSVYMTMELLEGEALSDWIEEGGEGEEQGDPSGIISQLAEGLAYAHSKGFVHSDLKPENVFVTAEGRVKILDFGIARIADEAAASDSFDAGILGALTPRYASLEMVQRSAEPAPADDLYALGLIAYQLYAGQHPFDGQPADQALANELRPQRPKSMTRYQWAAVEKSLRFRREERTQSAREFLHVFSGAKRRRLYAISAAALLLLSTAFFAYQAEQEKGPSVPFSDLPTEVQAEISDNLLKGNQFLAIGDLDGASRYFIQTWQLHPRNAEAKSGLAAIVDQLESRVQSAKSDREREFLLRFFDAYADHPYFAGDNKFGALREKLVDALN